MQSLLDDLDKIPTDLYESNWLGLLDQMVKVVAFTE